MANPAFAALAQATAGAGGGIFASATLQPLEVVKTRIQTGQCGDATLGQAAVQILKHEGVLAFYRGLAAKCYETGLKNFVYFYLYDALLRETKHYGFSIGTTLNLVLGFVAGVGTTSSTMPLEVLSTRLQAGTMQDEGLSAMTRRILKEEGLAGLFKGYWFNVILCINPAIQNTVFDQVKAATLNAKSGGDRAVKAVLSPLEAFLLGALAKAVATVITYPLVRLKTILQAGRQEDGGSSPTSPTSPYSLAEDSSALARLARVYRGLGTALLKTVLQAALLYMMKDQIARLVVQAFKVSARFLQPGNRSKLKALSGRPLAS